MEGLLFDKRRSIYSIVIGVKMEQKEANERKIEDLVIEIYYFQFQITKLKFNVFT